MMNKDLQRSNDMLSIAQQQRDALSNQVLQALTNLVEANRRIAELEKEVAALKPPLKDGVSDVAVSTDNTTK